MLQWPIQLRKLHPHSSLLQSNQTATKEAESLPALREEVEEALRSLKAGKSTGVDNNPSELLKNGCERGNNNTPDSDMQEDTGDEGMAETI